MSTDGRFISFSLDGKVFCLNLDPDGNGILGDVVETICVSVGANGTAANGDSRFKAMSSNGAYVAFTSSATNLISGGAVEGAESLYIYDRVRNTLACLDAARLSSDRLESLSLAGNDASATHLHRIDSLRQLDLGNTSLESVSGASIAQSRGFASAIGLERLMLHFNDIAPLADPQQTFPALRLLTEDHHGQRLFPDHQGPSATLRNPFDGALEVGNLGFIEVRYSDGTGSGFDPASLSRTNIAITGITFDRVVDLGDGCARYYYDPAVYVLPRGIVQVFAGPDPAQDLAGNAVQSGIIGSFTTETAGPVARLVKPVNGAIISAGSGYLEVYWRDEGSAVDTGSIDQQDLTATGVTITRAEVLPDTGTVRYYYEGQPLPEGIIEIHAVDGQVADVFGNTSSGTLLGSLVHDSRPVVGQFITATDEFVEIAWQDRGEAGLDVTTIDNGDIAVTGVTIGSAEAVGAAGSGVYRYHYRTGEHLKPGLVEVAVNSHEVGDRAGNFSDVIVLKELWWDKTPPVAQLVSPAAESVVGPGLTWVEVTWSDDEGSGIDPASLDVSDIMIAGKPVEEASWNNGRITFVVAGHGFAVGAAITVSGTTPGAYSGIFVVASLIDGNSFQVELPTDPGTYVGGGLASPIDVDRCEDRGGGTIRYYFADDGDELPEGAVTIVALGGAVRDRQDNASRESNLGTVWIDRSGPSVMLVSPRPGQIIEAGSAVEYVEVLFADRGGAGVDAATIEKSDIALTNAAIASMAPPDNGVYRYYLSGPVLHWPVTVSLVGEVADTVGNVTRPDKALGGFTCGTPEVTVLGNGLSIADGDTTPTAADDTDFGSVYQGGSAVSRIFTVRNDGTAPLTLGVVTVPTGYTLTEPLSASLAPGASDTFTVRLDVATAGTKMGEVSFATNDTDENPFNFTVVGVVTAPEITLLGNGVSIADGDAIPSASDGTDFGMVAQGGTAISRVFTVRNDGTAPLTLGAVTVPAGYTLTEALSTTVAAGASDTFTVQLDAATLGTKSGEVSFTTNDSDENPFHFAITGAVNPVVVNLALGRTAVASTTYTGFPAANATDGNPSSRWSSQSSDSQWIYVDLGLVYTINRVVLRWEAAYGRGYQLQVSSNASTWSDVYSTTIGDGGVDDIPLSTPASGR